MNVIDKVAFLVHEPALYVHYANVWKEMSRSDFSIVLLRRSIFEGDDAVLGSKDFMSLIRGCGYDYCYFDDIVREGIEFKYVVTNHVIGGSSKEPATKVHRLKMFIENTIVRVRSFLLAPGEGHWRYSSTVVDSIQYYPLQIGRYQVRFMYGADIGDAWSLQDWNEIYDLFLCHGPNDEKQLRLRFNGKTALMGYPRYDSYFKDELDTESVRQEFGLDASKKTLLWMSTLGKEVSSIPDYAEAISELFEEYNVIARPHPIAFLQEPENIDLLRSLKFRIDDDATRDMNSLYKLVDCVLCDYGGSPFGAIYLDINLLLLNVKGAESQRTVENSSNIEIRGQFPVVSCADVSEIRSLLHDASLWKAQRAVRGEVSGKYFAEFKGTSAHRAAQILLALDDFTPGLGLQID